MNPEQLWETTLNPKSRTFIQLEIEKQIDADQKFNIWMGKDADLRKDILSTFEIDLEAIDA